MATGDAQHRRCHPAVCGNIGGGTRLGRLASNFPVYSFGTSRRSVAATMKRGKSFVGQALTVWGLGRCYGFTPCRNWMVVLLLDSAKGPSGLVLWRVGVLK